MPLTKKGANLAYNCWDPYDKEGAMTSIYSYIFTAFYNWLRDNEVNPRLLVDVSRPGVQVPEQYVTDGVILLSIYYKFVENFEIWPNRISFYTRFNGKKTFVVIPYSAMMELVCSDANLSIPLNMWLSSIELACHTDDEGNTLESKSEEESEDSASSSKVMFTLAEDQDNDDSQEELSGVDIENQNKPKVSPNFTFLE